MTLANCSTVAGHSGSLPEFPPNGTVRRVPPFLRAEATRPQSELSDAGEHLAQANDCYNCGDCNGAIAAASEARRLDPSHLVRITPPYMNRALG